jgi:hypothetical protein
MQCAGFPEIYVSSPWGDGIRSDEDMNDILHPRATLIQIFRRGTDLKNDTLSQATNTLTLPKQPTG